MIKAIRLRSDNVDKIIEDARGVGFDLSHLKDEMEYNALDGYDTILITDGSVPKGNITFTTMTDIDFRQTWKFKDHENPNMFVPIERV